ncbi:MAG: YihA family ribosome biogenesis GTP-binding protein [Flavobacteriales bacterium]|nr:YihA family ribosome biogenesis GTP-binding protein [Flavobacteriales bacterium]
MTIKDVHFVMSNSDVRKCPNPDRPEYAFIGRSNVGKSSLINMLMQRKKLAKTSSTPGKTQLINHYMVNDAWYLVDLPGYGYAKMPVKEKEKLEKIISNYILERKNLVNVFVLIDSRHSPQQIDLEFMNWLGISGIPFTMVFTKADKLKKSEADSNLSRYNERMLESWEELPMQYLTSAENGSGRDELLNFIETLNSDFSQTFSQ